MKASLDQEIEIMTQALALRDSPLEFAEWAYPWGTPGTPFEKGLRAWQRDELKCLSDHVQEQVFRFENDLPLVVYKSATRSGRGPGKSAVLGIVANWHMSTHVGAPTIVTANTERQLRDKTFPEYAVWFNACVHAHWFALETMRITPQPWLAELVAKPTHEGGLGINTKYWYVAGQMWSEENPDAFAGAHNPYGMLLQFDEAAGIASTIWSVAEGFFTERNPYRFWQAMSQMRYRDGRFYEVFEDAMHRWPHLRTIDTRGVEGVDQAVIEDQVRRYGADSDFVRVEIAGLPPRTSEDQFIPWANVSAAQKNEIYRDWGEPLILGVDPAPRGRTAWRFRQGRNARDCCGRDTRGILEGKDNMQIAEWVIDLDQKYKPDAICIDFGMGTGVIDYLNRKYLRHKIHEVKFGGSAEKDSEWGNHGIELWAKTRDWLPGGMVEQDDGEKGSLSHQLLNRGWRWSGKEEGKKVLEAKVDLATRGIKSPDDADALACTFEVNPPRTDTRRPDAAMDVGEACYGE